MDIRVGAVAPVGPLTQKTPDPQGVAEARVLAVRTPRRGRRVIPGGRVDQRRRDSPSLDPPGARVLVLMVVDGTAIPDDALSGNYRVVVRFSRR
jgi:hypothetical protein